MLLDIYVITLLFFVGIISGLILIIIGLKAPLKEKCYANTCEYCNNKYNWYELIPIFSYFISRGKCKYCKKDINIIYPILEILTGFLYSLSYIIYGFSYELIASLVIISLMIIIIVSDTKYYVILDEPLIISSIIILISKLIFFGTKTFFISIISGILIFTFMLLIKIIGDKLFKSDSLGGGDIKLAGFFGFCLGIRLSIISLIGGSLLAFPFALYSMISKKNKEIPFGPYLIISFLLTFTLMEQIKSILSILFIK